MLTRIIATDGDLSEGMVEELRLAGLVACDIETSGLDWRTEKIGTCQFYSPTTGAIVVIINENKFPQQLISLLEDSGVTKVFHHAPFDLKFLRRHWNVCAQSVVCTKVASRLLFPKMSRDKHSLKSLLWRHLGIGLDKSEQSSDWTAPYLSEAQLSYAAADVCHLLALWEVLKLHILDAKLMEIYNSCMKFLPTQVVLEMNGTPDIFSY